MNVPLFAVTAPGEDCVRDLTKIVWLKVEDVAEREVLEVARELKYQLAAQVEAKRPVHYTSADSLVPLVYSFNRNGVFLNEEFRRSFGNLTYMISQTPNVMALYVYSSFFLSLPSLFCAICRHQIVIWARMAYLSSLSSIRAASL